MNDHTIIEVLKERKLLGRFIDNPTTFQSWFCFLRAFFGLPPTASDKKLFTQCTGRTKWPSTAASEAWLPIGVRGGKSYVISLLALYLACFKKYELSKGELGHLLIVSPTRKQSRIIKNYISGFIEDHPVLRRLVVNELQEEILLNNNICISIISSDYKSLRGFTAVACIVDEIAYLSVEGAKPDEEVIRALRTRLLTTGGPLFAIGSPYARRGQLYEIYKKYYGKDSEILVWQAPSRIMNPTLSQKIIDRAIQEDPEAAKADYLAEFRSDIETFVSREAVEACVVPSRYELSPIKGVEYLAFCDPAGGSGQDSMTLAIAHSEGDLRVLDAIREARPPFSPEQTVAEFAQLLRRYWVRKVIGDRFGGMWCQERFRSFDVFYELSEMNKSMLYQAFLPLLNSQEIQLLANNRLVNQISNLERKASRGGRDLIDHPPGQHDDLANVVAGVLAHPKKFKRVGTWGGDLPSGVSRTRHLSHQIANAQINPNRSKGLHFRHCS